MRAWCEREDWCEDCCECTVKGGAGHGRVEAEGEVLRVGAGCMTACWPKRRQGAGSAEFGIGACAGGEALLVRGAAGVWRVETRPLPQK
jgi:hypothetical protein